MKARGFFGVIVAVALVFAFVGCSKKSANPISSQVGLDVMAIYTDTATTAKFTNGYNLYVWGNTGSFQVPPSEVKLGTNTLDFVAGNLGWAGIGFQPTTADSVTGVNISAYKTMHFWIKSNTASPITACLSSVNITGNAPALNISSYGYVADSTWHEINIPLADWPGVDLTKVNVYAGFVMGAGTVSGQYMLLDDIWYAK